MMVLLTGGGKTLLVTLPTLIDSTRVHIFIALFRALVNNMVERFRADGLEVIKW